ncbi:MAG: UMP kinase [Fimbriimonadales bacterium]|nr:UMP kinase [Fimbriimonadales bacterium]
MPERPKIKRALLKLSGEAFAEEGGFGLDPQSVKYLASEIVEVYKVGVETAVVIGGGNFVRGDAFSREAGIEPAVAHYMGMLATIINALALQEAIEKLGVFTRVMSALEAQAVCETFIRRRALRHLEKGRIVLLAGGTGNPFFTTDTAAALRAQELNADVLIKGTKVDGVYDQDPCLHADAQRFAHISFDEVIHRRLRVMDQTAFTLCREFSLPIIVLNIREPSAMKRAVLGEPVGTLVGGAS